MTNTIEQIYSLDAELRSYEAEIKALNAKLENTIDDLIVSDAMMTIRSLKNGLAETAKQIILLLNEAKEADLNLNQGESLHLKKIEERARNYSASMSRSAWSKPPEK